MSEKPRKSFAERRQTIRLQMEKMYRDAKTKYRRRFAVAIIIVLLLLLALILFIIFKRHTDDDICLSDECEETANYMHSNLNPDVKPCDDFFEFSCGGWVQNNPRPHGRGRWSSWSTLSERNIDRVIHILDQQVNEKVTDAESAEQKTMRFFRACKNIDKRNEIGLSEIKRLLATEVPFPLLMDSFDDSEYNWEKVYVYTDVKLHGVQPFFNNYISYDQETNFTTRILYLTADDSLSDYATLLNEQTSRSEKNRIEASLRDRMKNLTLLVSDSKNTHIQRLNTDIENVIELGKRLANLTLLKDKNKDTKPGIKLDMYQMEYKFTKVKWFKIMSEIFDFARIKLKKDEAVYINDFYYFTELGNILSTTGKRTIANYVAFKVLHNFGSKVIPKLSTLDAQTLEENKYKDCYYDTSRFFHVAMTFIYVKHYFKTDLIAEIREFVKHLKASVTLALQQNEWMDDETKMRAQLKLNKMLDFVASPTTIKSEKDLDDLYKDLGYISSENYYSTYKKVSKRLRIKTLKSLREQNSEGELNFDPAEINAYYMPSANKFAITSGILQPPFYYTSAPIAMNFGAIGTVIGHEIIHGFDDYGSQYDEKGKFENWWKNETRHKYEERVDCFRHQYSQITEPINGTQTIGDNMADNVGLQLAYRAYKMYSAIKDKTMDLKLPKSMEDYSKEQLFFIAYANLWCSNDSKDYLERLVKSDSHAPDRVRAIVPPSNFEQFSKAFQCEKGSRMNPYKKCSLW